MSEVDREGTVHMQYIVENWTELAIMAWSGYLQEGRGCVAIEAAEKQREGYLRVYYLSEATLRVREVWGIHHVCEPISEYDPNTEIVVLFRLPNNHQPAYKVNLPEAPTPPELYLEAQKGSETRQ